MGYLDFRLSADLGVLFLRECELICETGYKQRIVKLARIQVVRGIVMYEKTPMTAQYCEQLQQFTVVTIGLNLYPVHSEEGAAKMLIQLVKSHNYDEYMASLQL